MATTDCGNLAANSERCPCTYTSCSKRGCCCECLRSHLQAGELPACCFPPEVERTYDRSIARFVALHLDEGRAAAAGREAGASRQSPTTRQVRERG